MAVRPRLRDGAARLQCAAVGLYAVVAVALAALLVSSILHARRDGHGFDGVWWLLGFPCLYAAGMAAGAWRLRIARRRSQTRRRVFGLMTAHGIAGWGAALALLTLVADKVSWPRLHGLLPEALAVLLCIAALVAMLLVGMFALWMPKHVRRIGVVLLTALAGGLFALATLGLLVLGLLLLDSFPD